MSGPRLSLVEHYLRRLHERLHPLADGVVADYIPELAKADPRWFGIALATVDGHVYEVGDTHRPFTIQSMSKPFAYGLALEDQGKAAVLERIGVEPTGDAFNEISLAADSGRPLNPMINAGAIAATSLIAGHSQEDRWNRILALFSIYAGRSLELDEVVYRSERDTGHRNRAISHMLRNFEILEGDPEPPLDLYFRQCSIEVTCRDLAVMAATLATGGRNPVTGERALGAENVDEVLSVMTTCGMYDYAGEWVYRVGLPAKSGVSGGILAVLPGQLGIGVFSPPLDARGNSVRRVAVFEALSDEMELHFLRAPRAALSTVRARFDLDRFHSKRVRSDGEREALADCGRCAVVYQLQGDLSFSGMEVVVRRAVGEHADVSLLILDLSRVGDVDRPASGMMLELLETAAREGLDLVFVGLSRHPRMLRRFEEARQQARQEESDLRLFEFDDLDLAVEWCEDRLLESRGLSMRASEELPLEKHELLAGFEADEIRALTQHMERRELEGHRLIVRKGEPADALFLLVRGELSILSDTLQGRLRRLATMSPGMGFGEAFLVEHALRTAFVRTDRPSTCWVLERAAFRKVADQHPRIEAKLLHNLLLSTSQILDRLSHEVLVDSG